MKAPEQPKLLILDYFGDLVDPRVDRTKLHRLDSIIFITLCAIISGEDSWDGIASFGEAKKEWLSSLVDIPFGIPSSDTFRRVSKN
ncbi:MAG: transposase family protein [Chloroflexaceae bacterium]|nr:transposase family protein [Chloroflexaceae bacterium]